MFVRIQTRPQTRLPWATFAIVLLATAAFVGLSLLSPEARQAWLQTWGVVPAALIDRSAEGFAGLIAARPQTLLTALLIHADWLHLLGNLIFVVIFGVPAERALGMPRFLLLFLVAGLIGNLAAAWSLDSLRSPIIGASGAVSGVVGAWIALFPRARLGVVLPLGVFLEFVRLPGWALIGFWVLLQVLFTLAGPEFGEVAWVAHLTGFAVGVALAMAWRPYLTRRARSA